MMIQTLVLPRLLLPRSSLARDVAVMHRNGHNSPTYRFQKALDYAVDRSFNSINIDWDMPMNDTVVISVNWATQPDEKEIDQGTDWEGHEVFRDELKSLAQDSEGPTKSCGGCARLTIMTQPHSGKVCARQAWLKPLPNVQVRPGHRNPWRTGVAYTSFNVGSYLVIASTLHSAQGKWGEPRHAITTIPPC